MNGCGWERRSELNEHEVRGVGGKGGADKGGDARGLDAAREVATRDYQREGNTTTAH